MGWIDWLQPRRTRTWASSAMCSSAAADRSRCATPMSSPVRRALARRRRSDVKARVRNDSASAVTATVSGRIGSLSFARRFHWPPRSKAVTFGPADVPGLHLVSPRVWWPAGMGGQPLYRLDLTASVSGAPSDTAHESFGIRDVKAPLNADGARQFNVNGRRLLVKAAAGHRTSSCAGTRHMADRLKYALDLGLNTIRRKATSNRTSSSISPTATASSRSPAGSAATSGRARSTARSPARSGPPPTTRSPRSPWPPRPPGCATTECRLLPHRQRLRTRRHDREGLPGRSAGRRLAEPGDRRCLRQLLSPVG